MTQELKRSLGFVGAVSCAVGLVVASTTLVSMGQGFGLGGPGFLYAMLLAAAVNLFVAFSFGELSAIVPRAGSINYYTLPAMGAFPAILSVLSGYVIVSIFAGSAESAVPGLIFHDVFAPGVSPVVFSVVMVVALIIVNILGIEVYGWVQVLTSAAMILSLVVMGIIGLTGADAPIPFPEVWQNFNPLGWEVFTLTALGFWLFVGVEFVCPLAEEVHNPRRTIPLAMALAIGVILVAKIIFGFASVQYVPLEQLAGSVSPHVDAAAAMLGGAGAFWMAIITILATISTVNTLLASIPRMIYGMALNGQAPAIFARIHPRFKTPWIAILLEGAFILIPLLIGIATIETVVVYILAAALAWFITYIIAHLNVIILRQRYPAVKRSFKSPFYPIPQVLGIAAMIYMMLNIFPDPEMKRQIYTYGIIFLALAAVFSALWVKLVMKRGLFAPMPLAEVVGEEEPSTAAPPSQIMIAG